MTRSSVTLVLCLLCLTAATARAALIPGLFNTGVDGLGAPLAGGSVDPHYTLISSADPAFPGPDAIIATTIPSAYWIANSATSKWIAPTGIEAYPSGGTPHPAGDYIYRLSFDLAGIDTGTVSITGKWGADNSVSLRLNGAATGNSTTSYSPLVAFTVSTGFHSGINNLDFVVHNLSASGSNPTGLRVDALSGTGTAIAGVGDGLESGTIGLSVSGGNPARGLARFAFMLPGAGTARLQLYDLSGRAVRTLSERRYAAGHHEATWDGLDTAGRPAGPGVYFVQLQAEGGHVTRRVVWLR